MQNSFVFPSLLALLVCAAAPVSAQSVTPARDGTGTVITREGDRYIITGGSRSGDGANLFQSFERLGLNANEIATFMTQPGIANILGRVTGGDASVINGLLQVSGGNSNLYLINPAGILFGANARLDIPGSFTATTASGIGFGTNTFNAIGENNYADLVGTPDSYAFTLSQPGAIANAGDLAVNPGESLSLLGGVVVNTGTLSAPGGTVTVAAIPGANRVRVSQDGALLSIELESMGANATNPIPFTALSLPELLTGGGLGSATSLTVDPDGTVRLAGAVIPDIPGTAVVSGVVDAAGAPSAEINVLGDRVALLSANLNASGLNGGGNIRIGGDSQGQGTVFNASNVFVSADSVITADAIGSGNGGRVIVWSDDSTQFAGTVTARGGIQGGNSGAVEISGAQTVNFSGGRVAARRGAAVLGTGGFDGLRSGTPSSSPSPSGSPSPSPSPSPSGSPSPSPSPSPSGSPSPTPRPTPSGSPTPECFANCANTSLSDSLDSTSSAAQSNVADPAVLPTKLLNIQLQTGVTPALVYISFAPTGLAGRNDLSRLDAIATQQVTDYLDRENPAASVLTTPSRDDDQLELLLVLSDGDIIRRPVTGVTRAMVAAKNRELLRAITSPYSLQSTAYLAPAQELYRWLIAPIEAELGSSDIQNVSFVVDAGLRAVPIAVLHDGEQFLVEKYSIGMMPSLSLTDTRYQNIRDLPVLAMGASDFDSLADLPAVPLELATIASEDRDSVQFLNDGFTLENLLQQRRDRSFGIVHLATHAVFNPGALENSFIQLGDRRLSLDQLRQLQFNNPPVELLVLSACQTALGDPSAELGFGGLAVQAGVRTVLASLWSVSDTGTLGFMSQFYHQLRSAPTRSEALRQTQLAMISGEIRIENGQLIVAENETIALTPDLLRDSNLNFRHPYYWAAFTMIGNPW